MNLALLPLGDNPSLCDYLHMFNTLVPAADQKIRAMMHVHMSLYDLTKIVAELHNSHHLWDETMRCCAEHKK